MGCRKLNAAVCQALRGAPFAADDRSYRGTGISCGRGVRGQTVGAVRGRESGAAVCQALRGVPFAADDRSYRGI